MSVSFRHTFEQGPVLAALAKTVVSAVANRKGRGSGEAPSAPGPVHQAIIKPRSDALIRDYIRHVGGNPSAYRGVVPFHLFPQWGFPMLGKTLEGIPWDLTRVLNAGCSVEINAPVPAGVNLAVTSQLVRIDANEKRVILFQRLTTGTDETPEALVVEQRSFVPLGGGKGSGGKKGHPQVPENAREIGRFKANQRAGLDFAILTGDFNPLHWVPAYAKAAGHPSPILHGFSQMARSIELLNRNVFAGDVTRLKQVEVRFTRPLRLPANIGVFIDDEGGFSIGKAASGPAYMTGTFQC